MIRRLGRGEVPFTPPRATICLLALLLLAASPLAAQTAPPGGTPFRPVAVVNDTVITGFDLDQRVRLLRLLGFPAASAEALQQAALTELVDDRLKLIAGERLGLAPNASAIEEGYGTVAESLEVSVPELRTLLANQGISKQAMDDFVAAGLVWRSVIQTRFMSRVEPGEAEIDGEIALLAGNQSADFRLQEIGLPSTADGRTPEQTMALAEQLRQEATGDEAFTEAAERFSRAASAQQGGNVGWVSGDNLPPEIREVLSALAPGEISPPIQVQGGVTLFRLIDRRERGTREVDTSDPAIRQRVRDKIVRDQSARLADGFLQELKRDAIIEIR